MGAVRREFAEALIAQLAVEISEEKEITKLTSKINEDADFTLKFDGIEQISEQLLPELKQKASEFLGIPVSTEIKLQFPELKDFKKLKGKKVFCVDDTREYVDDLFNAVANEDLKKIVDYATRRCTGGRVPVPLSYAHSAFVDT